MIADALKPELKKFIIPTLLLLGFVFVLNQFYKAGVQQDEYACLIKSYVSALELIENSKFCHTAGIEHMYGSVRIDNETEQMFESAIEKAGEAWMSDDIITQFMLAIDPILPVPCEYAATMFCEQYMSETSHECMVDSGIITQMYYRPASILAIIVNGMFLIAEGYVLSCLICIPFGLWKAKPTNQPTKSLVAEVDEKPICALKPKKKQLKLRRR
jgi:hypothetical protein